MVQTLKPFRPYPRLMPPDLVASTHSFPRDLFHLQDIVSVRKTRGKTRPIQPPSPSTQSSRPCHPITPPLGIRATAGCGRMPVLQVGLKKSTTSLWFAPLCFLPVLSLRALVPEDGLHGGEMIEPRYRRRGEKKKQARSEGADLRLEPLQHPPGGTSDHPFVKG